MGPEACYLPRVPSIAPHLPHDFICLVQFVMEQWAQGAFCFTAVPGDH